MTRAILVAAILVLAASALPSQDFSAIDTLHFQKRTGEELAILQRWYDPALPQAAVVWRILRAKQLKALELPTGRSREKLALYDDCLGFGRPLLDRVLGSQRDKAKVVYFHAASLGFKAREQGILNSLFMASDLRSLCDRALDIDPGFADPWYLKALIDRVTPDFAGGDKAKMGASYARAIELDPTNVRFLGDYAIALKLRNRSSSWNKDGNRGVPAGKSDIEYAKEVARRAYAAYAALSLPNFDQSNVISELKAAGFN